LNMDRNVLTTSNFCLSKHHGLTFLFHNYRKMSNKVNKLWGSYRAEFFVVIRERNLLEVVSR
jgi:hypothetical protein